MSRDGESGLPAGDAIRMDREASSADSAPELRSNVFSEETPSPYQPLGAPKSERASCDPLLVVTLRGVAGVTVILMPLVAIVLCFHAAVMATYESRSRLAVGAGSWAVLAMWMVLDKGPVGMLQQAHRSPAFGWLLLGLGSLGAALGALGYLVSTSR